MRIAYFDCTSGISGDMTLGALVDAGADIAGIESAIQSMGLGEISIRAETVKKYGFRATQIRIEHPPEHAHRHLHHIEAMLDQGDLTESARGLARKIFANLGAAEAKVHGTTIEKVHFHEVGAVDSIADITGVAVAMDQLGIGEVHASPVPTGSGTITIAHGKVGVPAPATADLLRGVPIASSDIEAELTTPTGAAILKTMAKDFGPIPSMRIERIGYGAGTHDLERQANVLRVLISEATQAVDWQHETDRINVIESNIDDATPEQLAWCSEQLFDAGALDVFQTPIVMKKGRSAVQLTVLCDPTKVQTIESTLLQNSSAIGLRRTIAQRTKLIRKKHSVETEHGTIEGKIVWVPPGKWRFSAEHESIAAVAKDRHQPLQSVREAANRAFLSGTAPEPPAQSD